MNEEIKFSVLMTTYDGEKPAFLDASLASILINQSLKPNQLVLVIDGPIRNELNAIVEKYKNQFYYIIDVIYSPTNQGQSKASALGLNYVKYDILARMDSDDICVFNRFELEMEILKNQNIDVVGGLIGEFQDDPQKIEDYRVVPEKHCDIVSLFPKRMALNNVTVMMRKKILIKSGGYGRDTVNEDYSVYVHMLVNGAKFYNIQKVLCYVRVGNGMVKRRRDLRIFNDWRKDQKFLRKNKVCSRFTSFMSNFRCFFFVVSPNWLKTFLYKKVLRKKKL